MKLLRCAVLALGLGLQTAAQSRAGGEPAAQQPSPVMTIDGVPISADEYGRYLIDHFSSRMASDFGEQHLVRKAAAEADIELEEGALEREIDGEIAVRVEKAFLGNREDWLDELRRTGWTAGGHREYRRVELEPWMLASAMTRKDRVVPEELIVRDWELFYGPSGKEYSLSGILVKVEVEMPEQTGREIYEAQRRQIFARQLSRALEIRERALSGADFAALAREVSDDPATRAAGGRIDAKFRPPGWNEHFVQSILALGAGAISTPLYAKGGYWIVRVEGVVETPLDSVRAELEQRLVELGPESFEVGAVWSRITAGMQVELLPALFESTDSRERNEPVIGLLVNGEPVPRKVFASWLLRGRGEHYARDFAERWCVERRARELGLGATESEVEQRLLEFQQWMIDQSYKGSRDAWLTYMRARGRDESGWRREWQRRVRIDVLCEKIIKAERLITEADLVARWQQIYGREGRWIEARMIAVDAAAPVLRDDMRREDVDRAIREQYDAARARAEELRRRIADGEDFASLARAHSSDADSRSRGGQLTGRFRPDEWPAPLAEAVMQLDIGAYSPVLETNKGFALFEVLSAREVPFDAVKAELQAELANERVPQGDLAALRNVLYQKAQVVTTPQIHGEE